MKHEWVTAFAFQSVNDLRVPGRPQRNCTNGLSFAPSEKCRTVCFRQYINLAGNRSDRAIIAPVNARFARQNTATNNVLFEGLKDVFNVVWGRAIICCKLSNDLVFYLPDTLIARSFLSDSVSLSQWPGGGCLHRCYQFCISFRGLPFPARLASFGDELVDSINNCLHLLVCKQHGAQHLIFSELFGLRLHHQHCIFRAGHHHIQLAICQC